MGKCIIAGSVHDGDTDWGTEPSYDRTILLQQYHDRYMMLMGGGERYGTDGTDGTVRFPYGGVADWLYVVRCTVVEWSSGTVVQWY